MRFLITIFLLLPLSSFAYEPTQTHAGLTEQVVEFYNLKSDKKISSQQKELIIKGAMDEDEPATRAVNHFYDPVRQIGVEGGRTAKTWALDDLEANDFSWNKAIGAYARGDMDVALIALGHNIHLVEDMGVPDHTRNDQHLPFLDENMGGHSPYEDWAKEQKNRQTMQGFAQGLFNAGVTPRLFLQLGEYFDFLANYSNKNFFSRDTIFRQDVYIKPAVETMDRFYGYSRDEITGSPEKLVKRIERKDYTELKISDNKDTSVLSSYFDRLSRQIIPSGAGVIELFFKEGEQARIAYQAELRKQQDVEAQANAELARTLSQKGFFGSMWSGMLFLVQDNVITPVRTYAVRPVGNFVATAGRWVSQESPVVANTAAFATVAMAIEAKDRTRSAGEWTAQKASQTLTIVQQTINSTLNTPVDPRSQLTGPMYLIGDMPTPLEVETPATLTAVVDTPSLAPSLVFIGNLSPGFGGGGGGGSSPAPEVPETPSDTIAPVISILGDNPATTTINIVYVDAGATASDIVDGVLSVNVISDVDTTHVGAYTVTYVASDLSHNTATSTRTVNVIDITESTTTPDFNANGDADATEDDVVATSTTPVFIYTYSDLNTNGIADATEDDVVATSTMSLSAGEYHFHNLTIINNATLFLGGDTAASTSPSFLGVKIVADNITVSPGAAISANGRGYNISGTSPGSPSESNYSRGANYGGIGLIDMKSAPYGSATHPTDMGSGSRYCCTDAKGGGGTIHLVVAGVLTNDGVISADGGPSGSGGSVYVETSTLAGTGDLRANGGPSEFTSIQYYPGAGGRVAAYYQTSSFLGNVEALGGCSSFDSGWTMTCGDKGTTGLFDTTTNDLYINSSWRFQKNDEPFQFNRIILAEGASVTMDDAVTVVANELLLQDKSSFVSSKDGTLTIPKIVVDGGTLSFPEPVAPPASPTLSSEHTITAFDVLVESVTVSGVVDETAHTISLVAPFGTDIRILAPSVMVSTLATSSPASGSVQDFTNPVTYTVTAEDGSTQEYIVTVTVAPDTVSPTIVSYTFNGTATDIVADFATTTPAVALVITASENVDWVSIKIEDQNNPDNYKTFFSGAGCVDGTAVCAKSWTGALSHGTDAATAGAYRVKVNIKDAAGNPYQDYLSPYFITVGAAIP